MQKLLITFSGPPNTGKTTAALTLTSKLKQEGYKVDFVGEVARELIYEYGGFVNKPNQLYITGMQIQRILNALKVQDIIICDSDPGLGAQYLPDDIELDKIDETFYELTMELFKYELRKLNVNYQVFSISPKTSKFYTLNEHWYDTTQKLLREMQDENS